MSMLNTMTRYKAWANQLTFASLQDLPEDEVSKTRPTAFKNMLNTLSHTYVVDHIFQAHLEGRPHHYTARNTSTPPPLSELWQQVTALDQWYIDYAAALSPAQQDERIRFQFIGGGEGVMSRGEMILHVVNHATYHRGFVADMMYQIPAKPPTTDLPVFLRDVAQ